MSGALRYVVIAGELDMGAWFIHLQTDNLEEAQRAMGQSGLRLIDTRMAAVNA